MPATPTLLTTRNQLLDVVGPGDAFARYDLPEHLTWAASTGRAVVVVRRTQMGWTSASLWGPRADLQSVIADVLPHVLDNHDLRGISVPVEAQDLLPPELTAAPGWGWEWMWTDTAPPPSVAELATGRAVDLDDTADADEIAAFAAQENPRFEGQPGTGKAYRWLGVRDEKGALIGCGSLARTSAGAPHLAGIVTAAARRGQGIGRALSARLTREAIAQYGVCTLGMYSDNDTARRLYVALGYHIDKRWASRRIAPTSTPTGRP